MAFGDFTANTNNEYIGMPYVPDTSQGSSVAITSYFLSRAYRAAFRVYAPLFLSIFCLLLFKFPCDRLNDSWHITNFSAPSNTDTAHTVLIPGSLRIRYST